MHSFTPCNMANSMVLPDAPDHARSLVVRLAANLRVMVPAPAGARSRKLISSNVSEADSQTELVDNALDCDTKDANGVLTEADKSLLTDLYDIEVHFCALLRGSEPGKAGTSGSRLAAADNPAEPLRKGVEALLLARGNHTMTPQEKAWVADDFRRARRGSIDVLGLLPDVWDRLRSVQVSCVAAMFLHSTMFGDGEWAATEAVTALEALCQDSLFARILAADRGFDVWIALQRLRWRADMRAAFFYEVRAFFLLVGSYCRFNWATNARLPRLMYEGEPVELFRDPNLLQLACRQETVRVMEGHRLGVCSLTFEGGRLFSGAFDSSIKVWDINRLETGATLTGHSGRVLALVCDSKFLYSGSFDRTVRVWDLESLECVGEPLTGHVARVSALACDQGDGRHRLFSGSFDETIRSWDTERLRLLEVVRPEGGRVLSLAVGAGCLFAGCDDQNIRVWDLSNMEMVTMLSGHTDRVLSLNYRKGVLFSGSFDHTIRVWNIKTGSGKPGAALRSGKSEGCLKGHNGRIFAVIPIGKLLFSSSGDRTIRSWDWDLMKQVSVIANGTSTCEGAFTYAAGRLIAGSQEGSIVIYGDPLL